MTFSDFFYLTEKNPENFTSQTRSQENCFIFPKLEKKSAMSLIQKIEKDYYTYTEEMQSPIFILTILLPTFTCFLFPGKKKKLIQDYLIK